MHSLYRRDPAAGQLRGQFTAEYADYFFHYPGAVSDAGTGKHGTGTEAEGWQEAGQEPPEGAAYPAGRRTGAGRLIREGARSRRCGAQACAEKKSGGKFCPKSCTGEGSEGRFRPKFCTGKRICRRFQSKSCMERRLFWRFGAKASRGSSAG